MSAIVKADAGRRALARVNEGKPRREMLVFLLEGETYAVPLTQVVELLKPLPITSVPRSGPGIMGVMSVRGRLATVIDPRERLRLPVAVTCDKRARILLAETASEELCGFMVDEVLQVLRVADEEIEPLAPAGDPSPVVAVIRPKAGDPRPVLLLDLPAFYEG